MVQKTKKFSSDRSKTDVLNKDFSKNSWRRKTFFISDELTKTDMEDKPKKYINK